MPKKITPSGSRPTVFWGEISGHDVTHGLGLSFAGLFVEFILLKSCFFVCCGLPDAAEEELVTRFQKFILLLVDGFVLASCLHYFSQDVFQGFSSLSLVVILGFWVLFDLSLFYVIGLYNLSEDDYLHMSLRMMASYFASAFVILLTVRFFSIDRSLLWPLLGARFGFAIAMALVRAIWLRSILARLESMNWLILASQQCLSALLDDLKKQNLLHKCFFLTDRNLDAGLLQTEHAQKPELTKQWLGTWDQVKQFVTDREWTALVIATDQQNLALDIEEALVEARFQGQRIFDLSGFYENLWRKVPIYYLSHNWFFLSEGFQLLQSPVGLRVKRLGDVVLSTGLLLLTWPFLLIVALAVKLESPGPALYQQIRTGLKGRPFKIYKFRSMRTDAEKDGAKWAVKNDNRVTRVGKFIRLTRLDELPQLFNVLRGDMSFVGPRPERPEFNKILEHEIPFYNLRHLVRPGVTGWAQVLYRYGASVEDAKEKLQYDLYYIRHYSLILDMLIILRTVRVVLLGMGR